MRHYLVGIDLGTTHTVVAYAQTLGPGSAPGGAPPAIQVLEIAQRVGPGASAALPLLPSVRYQAGAGELGPGENPVVIGQWARTLGAQVPGRLVTSAKSWLSHPGVDRLAPILPWGAAADVPKVSPVEASASYLRHVHTAWNQRFAGSPLAQQDVVLTVPASFDEGARALTLQAAHLAGLPTLRLLEEPQAVFYDWLLRHRGRWATELAQTRLVLVCDVGGGTTDLSLIQVEWVDGAPQLSRIGVGKHLMLGGDNMDLALAHGVETRLADAVAPAAPAPGAPRLSASQWVQLMDRCRVAKEQLLGADAPAQVQVTLLGGGARLVGGSRATTLTREEVERTLVEGFFPQVDASAQAQQSRSGIVAFGLPYARDPAITRHIADFLRQHAQALPDTLLLNGGVFHAKALVHRLEQTLGAWRGAPLRLLHNDNPDVAVARGAVAYALAQQGLAPTIGGGSARSYFLLLDEPREGQHRPAAPHGPGGDSVARGICILPRGSAAGQEVALDGRTFALRLGQPVRFHLFAAVADAADHRPFQRGEQVRLDSEHFTRLPPVAIVLRAACAYFTGAGGLNDAQEVPVELRTALTEVGTLEVHCVSLADASHRWRLEFDLRHPDAGPDAAEGSTLQDRGTCTHPMRLEQAIAQIDRVFGPGPQALAAKEVKQLRLQLEHLLGAREHWATPALRALFDALWQRARGRRRSAEHERAWLNLAGFCLRPGFGDPLDDGRLQQLWTQFPQGVQHRHDKQVCAEWWTLWRRVAGGLAAPAQLRLLEDFAYNVYRDVLGPPASEVNPVPGSADDMLRLGASLERIPPDYKVEIGAWLLDRLQPSHCAAHPLRQHGKANPAGDSHTLWALGRIGARQPLYGNPHDVVPADTACAWVETLLALDWKCTEAAAFAAVHLARVTDDHTRDLPLAVRERVLHKLLAIHAPPIWVDMVRHRVELDAATTRRVLGESLPPGLVLMA